MGARASPSRWWLMEGLGFALFHVAPDLRARAAHPNSIHFGWRDAHGVAPRSNTALDDSPSSPFARPLRPAPWSVGPVESYTAWIEDSRQAGLYKITVQALLHPLCELLAPFSREVTKF